MNRVCQFIFAPCKISETGAALFVSLVFLLIMTIVGLAGMQNTSLQEKMAGHLRDSDLAFQAAESALKAGEAVLSSGNIPTFVCTSAKDGLYVNSYPGTTSDCPTYLGSPSNNQNGSGPENENFWINNTDVVCLSSKPPPNSPCTNSSTSTQFNNLAEPPKYVIESLSVGASVGQTPGQTLEAGIPVAPGPKYYRVTAHGTGLSSNSVVVLQTVVRR